MKNLVKTGDGKYLQESLARLSMYISFFSSVFAVLTLKNHTPKNTEEFEILIPKINYLLNTLWQRSLLERISIPSQEDVIYLYRLPPTLRIFAREYLTDTKTAEDSYWKSMRKFASIMEEQVTKDSLFAQIALHAVPDLLAAAEFKNDKESAKTQVRTSKVLTQFGLYDNALRILTRAHDIFVDLDMQREYLVTLHSIARILVVQGELNTAISMYQHIIEFAEKMNDQKIVGDTLHEMAGILITRGKLDEAMNLHLRSLEIKNALNDLKGKSATLGEMAKIFVARGDLDKGLELQKEKLSIVKDIGYKRGEAIALGEIGSIEEMRDNLDVAIQIQEQGLSIAQQLGDKRQMSVALNNIAVIHFKRGDLNKAMQLFQQSLEIKDFIGDFKGKASTLNNMGVIFFENKDYLGALKSMLSSWDIVCQLQAKLEIKDLMFSFNNFKQTIGNEEFRKIWLDVTGDAHLPEWLD